MAWEKDFIKSVRKKQLLNIRSSSKGPQTSEFDQAAKELHLKRVHFIKEIIQKFDGSTYGEGVVPFLEFVLTKEDVADVGASATLLVLNNDVGLTTVDITVLCNLATSPELVTWLKPAFKICETPKIISNGFRLSFQDEACKETGVGCVVPKWTESPTDTKILSTIGREELPATVIILPIRYGKDELVRYQLKDLCPEVILFLSSIRDLQVVDKTESVFPTGDLNLSVRRSDPLLAIQSRICKFLQVTINNKRNPPALSVDNFSYLIFQRQFPVMPSVQERQETHDWVITLAFPRSGRASSRDSGDVFSFVQTGLKTGFPFLIGANFSFTRPTQIDLFNEWNAGVLSCIPMAFRIAFEIMLQKRESKLLKANGITKSWEGKSWNSFERFSAYGFLPCDSVKTACRVSSEEHWDEPRPRKFRHLTFGPEEDTNEYQLEKMRCEILERLGTDSKILLSDVKIGSPSKYTEGHQESNWFSAKACVRVKPAFYSILQVAAASNHPAPLVVLDQPDDARSPTAKFVLASTVTKMFYPSLLSALGVPDMMSTQYESFLMDAQWLVNLPDKIYVRLLSFFAFEMILLDEVESRYSHVRDTFRILKVRGQKCPVELATFSEVSLGTELQYTPEDDAEWMLQWVNEFRLWDSAKFMPAETSKAMVEARDRGKLTAWVKKHGSLKEVSAENYADRLIEKLQVITAKSENCNPIDNTESTGFFPILVMQFLYSGIYENRLSWEATVDKIRNLNQVYIVDHKSSMQLCASQKLREEGRILLPPKVSRWSQLFPTPLGEENRLIVISEKYLYPQCPLVKDIVTSSRGPHTMFEFLKQSFNVGDIALV